MLYEVGLKPNSVIIYLSPEHQKFLLASVFFFAFVPWCAQRLEELPQDRKCTDITRRTFSTKNRLNTIAFCSPGHQQNISSWNFHQRAGHTAEILQLPLCSSIHNSNWKLTKNKPHHDNYKSSWKMSNCLMVVTMFFWQTAPYFTETSLQISQTCFAK